MYRVTSSCTCAKSYAGIFRPLKPSIISSDCDCTQTDLGLHCQHMLEGTFSHGAAHSDTEILIHCIKLLKNPSIMPLGIFLP